MKARLPVLVTALMVLVMLPQPALGGTQTGVLDHFTTVPVPGLAAEGVVEAGHTFYVSTINFAPGATDGSIFAFNGKGELVQTLTLPGLPIVGQAAVYKGSLFVVACSGLASGGAVVKIQLKTGSVETAFAPIPTGCPNGLTMDRHGNIYVADFAGAIDKVTQSGKVTFDWATGALLAAGASGIGPNDITYNHKMNAVFTTNTGLNAVVEIPINRDGSAGTTTVYATVPGPDGLVFDQKGDLYVASPFTNTIFLVTPDGSLSPMSFTGTEALYSPSAVILHGDTLYITNLDVSFSSPAPPAPYPSGYVSAVRVHPPEPADSSP